MNLRNLKIATGIAISLGGISSAQATDLAMTQSALKQEIPSIVSFKADDLAQSSNFRDPKLICNLAKLYATGQGVQQDNNRAFRLYRYAATNGVAEAQYALGLMYSDENGPFNVADAQQTAMYWLDKAAAQGHKQAAFSVQYLMNNNHYAGC